MNEHATDFEPNAKQQALLKAFADADYACTVLDACCVAEINPCTFYRWFDIPGFRALWEDDRERRGCLMLKEVDQAMRKVAAGTGKGNPAAAKLLYERFDKNYVPHSKQDLQHDVGPGARSLLEGRLSEIRARKRAESAGAGDDSDEAGAETP